VPPERVSSHVRSEVRSDIDEVAPGVGVQRVTVAFGETSQGTRRSMMNEKNRF